MSRRTCRIQPPVRVDDGPPDSRQSTRQMSATSSSFELRNLLRLPQYNEKIFERQTHHSCLPNPLKRDVERTSSVDHLARFCRIRSSTVAPEWVRQKTAELKRRIAMRLFHPGCIRRFGILGVRRLHRVGLKDRSNQPMKPVYRLRQVTT